MFQIISFIFIFFFAVLIIGFFILMKILNFLGIGKKKGSGYYHGMNSSSGAGEEKKTSETITRNPNKKKVFDKNEGEYIDFEDV